MDQRKMSRGRSSAAAPVTTTTVGPFKPAATNDDVRWQTAGVNNYTGTTVIVGLQTGTRYNFAIRFPGVTVPQGKTIQSATLTLHNTGNQPAGTNTVSFVMYGNAFDNPTMPLSTGSLDGMTLTTANTGTVKVGPVTAGTDKDIDVTSIVQELVNRSGWVSGNAMILTAKEDGTSTDYWNPESYDNTGTNEARLNITYVD